MIRSVIRPVLRPVIRAGLAAALVMMAGTASAGVAHDAPVGIGYTELPAPRHFLPPGNAGVAALGRAHLRHRGRGLEHVRGIAMPRPGAGAN